MGFLRTDYSDMDGFGPLPPSEYECIVSEVKMTESKAGNQMIKVTLTVRDDVDQEGKKRKFFDNLIIMDKMMWKLQQVAKAAQLPPGEDYETPEDFAKAIQYKCVRIKNKHEEYNGTTQDRIDRYMEPKFGGNADASYDDPFAGGVAVSDDLPF